MNPLAFHPTKLILGGITLIGAVALLLFSTQSIARDKVNKTETPAIAWTPASVHQTLKPGQTIQLPIRFFPKDGAENVSVQIAPEIAPYVSVEPTILNKVNEKQEVTLMLTFTASTSSIPVITAGSIWLERMKETGNLPSERKIGESLPVSVEVVWTQTTLEQNIVVSSPPEFVASYDVFDGSPMIILKPARIPGEVVGIDGQGQIIVEVAKNPKGLPFSTYFGEDGEKGDLEEIVEYRSVNGHPAFLYMPDRSLGGLVVVIVPLPSGDFLHISDSGLAFQQDGSFDKILSQITIGGW